MRIQGQVFCVVLMVNIVMAQVINWRLALLFVMLLPEILEILRTLILYAYKLRHNGISNSRFTAVVEFVTFALIAAALFAFISPFDKSNFIYAIIYCVNFLLAKGLNFVANTI